MRFGLCPLACPAPAPPPFLLSFSSSSRDFLFFGVSDNDNAQTDDFFSRSPFSYPIRNRKKVGVPGAFTPTCHSQVPGYIEKHDEFKAKGINEIYVISVNDVFVIKYVYG
jgi:hypothetical protein